MDENSFSYLDEVTPVADLRPPKPPKPLYQEMANDQADLQDWQGNHLTTIRHKPNIILRGRVAKRKTQLNTRSPGGSLLHVM